MAPSFGFSALAHAQDMNGQVLYNTQAFRLTQGTSGRYGVIRRTTSGATTGWSLTGMPPVATVTDGNSGVAKVRFRFRLPTVYPNVTRTLWSWNCGPSGNQHLGVLLNTDGTVACHSTFSGAIVQGAASSVVPLGDGWVTVEFEGRINLNGLLDQLLSTATITFADGTVENLSYTSAVASIAVTAQMQSAALCGLPSGGGGFTSSWIGHIEFCDYALLMASNADVAGMGNLPGTKTTRMAQLRITGDGSLSTLAYSSAAAGWYSMNKVQVSSTIGDNRVATTTGGQQRDWAHSGVARLGASNVLALKLNQMAAGSNAGVARFLVGGVSVASSEADALPTVNATENVHYDRTGWTQAVFDALHFGVESVVTSGTYNCVALYIDVMHDGTLEFPADELNLGDGYRQEWLAWTGDGTNFRTLSGLSFKPQAALVFSPGESASPKLLVDVCGDQCAQAVGTTAMDTFYGFTASGLYVGVGATPAQGVNQNAQAYYGLFIRDDGSPIYDVSGPTPVVTAYEFLFVSGGMNRDYASMAVDFGSRCANGMAPKLLLFHAAVGTSGGAGGFKRPASIMGAIVQSLNGSAAGATIATCIDTLDANGVTMLAGTSMLPNANRVAPFIAWSDHPDLEALVRCGELAAAVQNTGYTLYHPARVSFEDEATVARPTLVASDHVLAGPTVSAASIPVFTVNAGESLLVHATTYNLGAGTRTLTWNGVAMTKVHGNFGANMGMEFWYAQAPTPGTGSIAWSSTATASRVNLGAITVADTGGIRTINGREGSLTVEVLTRSKDLIHGVFVSDALDSGSSYTVPTGATSLWNDGTIAAAGIGFTLPGVSANMVSAVVTEAGGSDVTYYSLVSFMPVAPTPSWDPYCVIAKSAIVSAAAAGYRLAAGIHVGTDNSTSYGNQGSLLDGTGITELTADYIGFNIQASAGTLGAGVLAKQNGNFWIAIAGPGLIVAESPPQGVDDAYDCDFNTLLEVDAPGVLANDLDFGVDNLAVDALVDDVTHGVLTLYLDGSFTYMPDADYVGPDSFTYTPMTDAGAGTLATVTITVLEDPTPPVMFDNRGLKTPLAWIEWKDSDDNQFRWSDRPIGNAPEPNPNKKDRRVLKWGDVQTQLSDEEGRLAGSALTCTVQDIDRTLRTMLVTEATRYLWGQPLELWIHSVEDRAAGLPPLRIFRGRQKQPGLDPRRLATLRAEDIVSAIADPSIMTRDIPRRRLEFTTADAKKFNNAEPIIYGNVGSVDTHALPSKGAINPIYVLDLPSGGEVYRLFMVAGHACKSVTCYYKGDLIPDSSYTAGHIYAPGKPGWPHGYTVAGITVGPVGTTYVEHGGRRYTVIAVRQDQINPDDAHFITMDVEGIETVGDGSGELITDYFDAYLHFLCNFALGNWQTGAWLGIPTWPDASPMIDVDSFTAAQAVTASRMGDGSGPGYQVRTAIGANGQAATLQDWLRRWNVSGDCRMTFWDGELRVHVPDRLADITITLDEDLDLVKDPPKFTTDDGDFATHFNLHGLPHYALHKIENNKWTLQVPPVVTTLTGFAVTNKNYPIPNIVERAFWMSEYDSAYNAAEEWLWRRRHPAKLGEIRVGMGGVYIQPGMYLYLRHREGESDWVTEPFLVETWKLRLADFTVELGLRLHQAGPMTDPVTITTGTLPILDDTLGTGSDLPPPSWEV